MWPITGKGSISVFLAGPDAIGPGEDQSGADHRLFRHFEHRFLTQIACSPAEEDGIGCGGRLIYFRS